MTILFVIASLSSGGAERVMSIMANYWANKGWHITVVTFNSQDIDFYTLDKRIERHSLEYEKKSNNKAAAIFNNIKKIFLLRKAINRYNPDAVISFIDKTNIITLIATFGLGIPLIISERVDPTKINLAKEWVFLRKYLYRHANSLVVQSVNVKNWAKARWRKLPVSIIQNPVNFLAQQKTKPLLDPNYKWCVAMGRLTHQKGFDLLLTAFTKVKQRDKSDSWRLIILGEGEERAALLSHINELGIANYVSMPGLVQNPSDYLFQANIFIMSSRYEGFPNALLEAMICGLPVISTNCRSGPAEIIQHNIDGILVEPENCDALASAMEGLMENEEKRKRLANEALKSASRFDTDKIMKQWEQLIYEVTDAKPH